MLFNILIGIWHIRYFFFTFILPSHHMNLRDQNAHTLVQRTDIFSCKFSVKVSLMLDNSFLVPSLCKLNHINLCFIQISTKSPAKLLFWGHPGCFGPPGKFEHSIKISRLSVSSDYGRIERLLLTGRRYYLSQLKLLAYSYFLYHNTNLPYLVAITWLYYVFLSF